MNPFEMVVLIVAIVMIGGVLRARYANRADPVADPVADPDAERMRAELRALKERIAVLERIATDDDRSHALDREIERLRDRP